MEHIHLSKIWEEVEKKDRLGDRIPFSFSYAKRDGSISEYTNATFSSIHSKGSTVNIMLDGEVKPKTFRRICFLKFNSKRIYI